MFVGRAKRLLFTAAFAATCLISAQALADSGGEDYSYVWFVSPLPNASFAEARATFDVEIDVYQGSFDSGITSVDLLVDDEFIESEACALGCVFEDVALDQGVHELRVVSDIGPQRLTTVYVDEPVPTGGEEGGQDDETGFYTPDLDEDGEASGCSLSGSSSGSWALLVLLLPGLRRRSRWT